MSPQLALLRRCRVPSTARRRSSGLADVIGGQLNMSISTENADSRAAPTGCSRCAARISP
jgi:hypothetical protein